MHGSHSYTSSRESLSHSHKHNYRDRHKTPEESKRSRYHKHKSSRDRSRSRCRDTRRHHHQHRSSSRLRSSSPYHARRKSFSRNYEVSHVRHTKEIPTELKLVTHDACYFLLKSNNFDNLLLAKAESVWSTPPQNEVRINNVFKTKGSVILIFCVKESNSFQGIARVSAESNRSYPPLPWVLPVGLSAKALSSVFTLDWICRDELPFARVRHLRNSLNMDRPVNVGRDGQELDAACGEAVCREYSVDWSLADARRAVEKARLMLTLRGVDVDSIIHPRTSPLH